MGCITLGTIFPHSGCWCVEGFCAVGGVCKQHTTVGITALGATEELVERTVGNGTLNSHMHIFVASFIAVMIASVTGALLRRKFFEGAGSMQAAFIFFVV